MMQPSSSQPILTNARTYLGTAFRHQGRSRHGVDCLGLLVCITRELELRDKHGQLLHLSDRLDYGKRPSGHALIDTLAALLHPTPSLDNACIAVFSLDHNPQHLGIITPYCHGGFGLLHAYAPAKKVVEHTLDQQWQQRIMALFHAP